MKLSQERSYFWFASISSIVFWAVIFSLERHRKILNINRGINLPLFVELWSSFCFDFFFVRLVVRIACLRVNADCTSVYTTNLWNVIFVLSIYSSLSPVFRNYSHLEMKLKKTTQATREKTTWRDRHWLMSLHLSSGIDPKTKYFFLFFDKSTHAQMNSSSEKKKLVESKCERKSLRLNNISQ